MKNGSNTQLAEKPVRSNPLALLPFALFLVTFVGTGAYLSYQGVEYAFYKYPAPVCVLPAIFLSVYLGRKNLEKTMESFVEGVGHSNIISMCLIYLLAGAFATVTKSIGGVDATVELGSRIIPSFLLTPSFFLISAFIATAMGTSMGAGAAMAPIAYGVCQKSGISPAVMAGAIMSGAMFGDNLSIISDTTIASTRTQGCDMKDKFRENVFIAIPAALICFLIYSFFTGNASVGASETLEWYKVIPYLVIIVLAVVGYNVFLVLALGIVLAGLIGMWGIDSYDIASYTSDIYKGFTSTQEIFLFSMFVGGLGFLMEKQGGLAYITSKVMKMIEVVRRKTKSESSTVAELGLALLVSLVNLCTANNTVAIVVSGKAAKEIADQNHIRPSKSASILDIYSCAVQGLIPYGAQALLIGSLFDISPVQVVTHSYYPVLLALSCLGFTFWKK